MTKTMEHKKCETVNESKSIDDAQCTITIKENIEESKFEKHGNQVTKTMKDEKFEPDDEPDIIIIEDQEPTAAKENCKKPKTKKHRRKVKLGKKYNNDMETLYITQKLKVKKSKFSCVININNVGRKKKRRPSSIVRSARNVCKREAYYNRIVPICMRNHCFADNLSAINRCRTVGNRYFYSAPRDNKFRFFESDHYARSTHMNRYREEFRINKADLLFATKKSTYLSPVSSSPLADSLPISYEDISDVSFSSEDELDTLIKRTKKREHQFVFSTKAYSELHHTTPMVTEDVASSYSGGSFHSSSTLILPPLGTEAYSPTSSPGYMCNVSVPYSPTFTTETIDNIRDTIDNTSEAIDNISEGVDRPYSPSDPTNSLVTHEDENYEGRELSVKAYSPYSLASPKHVKIEEDHENDNNGRRFVDCVDGRNVKTEIGTNHMIKIEDIKHEDESVSEDYLNNGQIFETEMNVNNNIVIKSENVRREKEHECDINENFKAFIKVEKP